MLNYTPLKITPSQKISKHMVIALGMASVFAFGILGFLAWTLQSIQTQNVYLADRIDTYTVRSQNSAQGEVAGVSDEASPVLPPEAEATRKKVESMISVPIVGDVPTFALIDDLAKVKNEAFFTKAQTGDHLFVYPKSKIAVLYRPSTLKVINMAEVNQSAATSGSNSKVATEEGGDESTSLPKTDSKNKLEKTSESNSLIMLARTQEADNSVLQDAKTRITRMNDVEVSDAENPLVQESISKNRVVNISGRQQVVDDLIKEFGAEEGPLPAGVSANGADIVLILAKD